MKFAKPVYNSATKAYTCEITEGFRFDVQKEAGQPVNMDPYRASIAEVVLAQTNGWFTKPLASDWLLPRIQWSPTETIPLAFEGVVTLQADSLRITKEQFLFTWKLLAMKEAEKVMIDLQEDTPTVVNDVPLVAEDTPISIGPTRRDLQKRAVLEARSKAARALFKAERMTQDYIQAYGEDTEWEEEDEES
jgi:hypothetical protein